MQINLISDLMDLAKEENQTFKFHKECFSLIETVKQAFKVLEFSSVQKSIQMECLFSPKDAWALETIYGDQQRFEQILLNLISNALKFTKNSGYVKVELKLSSVV